MKNIIPCVATAVSLVACLAPFSIAGTTLSLKDAIQLAIKKNPELAAYRQQVVANQAEKELSARLSNPTMEMEAEEWGENQSDAKASLRIIQTLPINGERNHGIQAADLRVQIAEREASAKVQELTLRIKNLFVEANQASEQSALDRQAIALANEVLRAAQARYKAQTVPLTDVLRAETEVESSKLKATATQKRLQMLRFELASAIGDDTVANLTMLPTEAAPPPTLESLLQRLEQENPVILQAKLVQLVAEQEKKQVIASQLANPEVGIAYVRKIAQPENLVSLSLGWPLPVFNRNNEAINRQNALLEKAKSEEAVARNTVSLQLRQWYSDYLTEANTVSLYQKKLIPAVEEAYRQASLGYRYGRTSHLDLLDARRSLIEAREGLIESKGREDQAIFKIESLFPIQEIKE